MPSKTTSSADDGPVKKRPSAKEELERTMRRHETRADHVARDLGTRLQLHFPSRRTLFFVCLRKSHSLSLFLSPSSVDKKAERRKDATEKVAKLTSTLVSGINRGVLEVFENQKQVEKEAKNLQKKVDAFKEQSAQWVKSLETFDESLKSIGDFENYVMTLEKELSDIAEELKKSKT